MRRRTMTENPWSQSHPVYRYHRSRDRVHVDLCFSIWTAVGFDGNQGPSPCAVHARCVVGSLECRMPLSRAFAEAAADIFLKLSARGEEATVGRRVCNHIVTIDNLCTEARGGMRHRSC
jgi:hypothetical protein